MTVDVFCGQAWSTDELIDAGFESYLFNAAAVAQVSHLPSAWPSCPMCASPLRRIGTGQTWVCSPQ